MSPSPPKYMERFTDLFQDGEYWEGHEILEAPWKESDSDFLHGLILYTSAFVHLKEENVHGVRAQLDKALEALKDVPDTYLGIDVAAVRSQARRIRDAVPVPPEERPEPEEDEELDAEAADEDGADVDEEEGQEEEEPVWPPEEGWSKEIAPPALTISARRVRGDEPELSLSSDEPA